MAGSTLAWLVFSCVPVTGISPFLSTPGPFTTEATMHSGGSPWRH